MKKEAVWISRSAETAPPTTAISVLSVWPADLWLTRIKFVRVSTFSILSGHGLPSRNRLAADWTRRTAVHGLRTADSGLRTPGWGLRLESVVKLVVSLSCSAGYECVCLCLCGPVDKRMLCDAVYAFYIFRRNEFNVTATGNGERRAVKEGEEKEGRQHTVKFLTSAFCKVDNMSVRLSVVRLSGCLAVRLSRSSAAQHHMRLVHMSALCVLKVSLESWPISARLNVSYVLRAHFGCNFDCKGNWAHKIESSSAIIFISISKGLYTTGLCRILRQQKILNRTAQLNCFIQNWSNWRNILKPNHMVSA